MPGNDADAPVRVFISYAPEDKVLFEHLGKHLSTLKQQGFVDAWHDQRIGPGEHWDEALEHQLESARLFLLLVSSDFLASDECHDRQMKRALERERRGEAKVIPILARKCDWEHTSFKDLVPLPRDRRPVTSWPNSDEAWTEVALGIREAITKLHVIPGARPLPIRTPVYESAEVREMSEKLEAARARERALVSSGHADKAAEEHKEILALRRQLRDGGQLRAGDSLGEGRYLLLDRVGRGGFASVWQAEDRTESRLVAIKVLHATLARDEGRRERFFRGARVMAELEHEAVVRVLDRHGEDGGYFYFVMELVEGMDLRQVVLKGLLPKDEALGVILRIADALAQAHAKGIVHRDVKPANILLDEVRVPKLTDFDLVALDDTTGGTRTGAMGTFLYAAPEQLAHPEDADARADVYGLGMTAIFCVYGKELPDAAFRNPENVIAKLACSNVVKRILTQAIEVTPAKRFPDARAFCDALREASRQPPWVLKQRMVGFGAIGGGVLFGAVALGTTIGWLYCKSMASSDVANLWKFHGDRCAKGDSRLCAFDISLINHKVDTANKLGNASIGLGVTAGILGGAGTVFVVATPKKRVPIKRVAIACVSMIATLVAALGFALKSTSREAEPALISTSAQMPVYSTLASGPSAFPPLVQDAGSSEPCLGDMALIPAGKVQMGSPKEEGDEDEHPQHEVTLSPYCMDRTEVTVAGYRACVNDNKCKPVGTGTGCNWNEKERDNHPINCVDWNDADTYCTWAGKRLPTEAEWEYAARGGGEQRTYPWGTATPSKQLCWDGEGSDLGSVRKHRTCPAGSYATAGGDSRWGLQDMAGNVWEWTADIYAPYETAATVNPKVKKGPGMMLRVVRGGAWTSYEATRVRATRIAPGVSCRLATTTSDLPRARGPK